VSLVDIAPGEATRCFVCGPASEVLPREELQAYKHRHPGNHDGYVRFYCGQHVPAAPALAEVAAPKAARRSRVPGERREPAASRRVAVPERARPVCPDCFMEIPPTGVCGNCGKTLG
jgi:hypothetical protein